MNKKGRKIRFIFVHIDEQNLHNVF